MIKGSNCERPKILTKDSRSIYDLIMVVQLIPKTLVTIVVVLSHLIHRSGRLVFLAKAPCFHLWSSEDPEMQLTQKLTF